MIIWLSFCPEFYIPLIKRSVQTSVLLYVTNTHRHTEPTCFKIKHTFRFNSTNMTNCENSNIKFYLLLQAQ